MKVGILKETAPYERRVAAVPDTIAKMVKAGTEVVVETGAGKNSYLEDKDFTAAGATIAPTATALIGNCDIILKVNKPTDDEINAMKEGTVYMGFLSAFSSPDTIKKLNEK
ncbi:NAD(P)(+) transhydrogenase (Re/Si-specific) subunit alpha, partial [bacterium]